MRYRVISVIAATFLLAGCMGTAQKGALLRANNMIAKGKYESALTRLSEAQKYKTPTSELQAEIAFLRAKCHGGMKRTSDAVGIYKYIVSQFPNSTYGFQAAERLKQLDPK